jgi:hypothetical protein
MNLKTNLSLILSIEKLVKFQLKFLKVIELNLKI